MCMHEMCSLNPGESAELRSTGISSQCAQSTADGKLHLHKRRAFHQGAALVPQPYALENVVWRWQKTVPLKMDAKS